MHCPCKSFAPKTRIFYTEMSSTFVVKKLHKKYVHILNNCDCIVLLEGYSKSTGSHGVSSEESNSNSVRSEKSIADCQYNTAGTVLSFYKQQDIDWTRPFTVKLKGML